MEGVAVDVDVDGDICVDEAGGDVDGVVERASAACLKNSAASLTFDITTVSRMKNRNHKSQDNIQLVKA